MRAEDLCLDELIQFSEGQIDIKGRRMILHDLHAVGQFRTDIIDMVGLAQARRIFTRFGYFWGQADAAAMKRIFRWSSVAEWIKAGSVLHALQGLARTELHLLEVDEAKGTCTIDCTWHESGEARVYLEERGRSKESSCWIQIGYISGYASYCLHKSVYFIEQTCRAKGDDSCRVIGKDIDSWGKEIDIHLQYFHAEDIQGKIRQLSNQLRKKSLQLARQQEKLEKALHGPSPYLASTEVRSRSFQRILDVAERASKFDSSVLITGETGVGKEVLARHIHQRSPRAKGPFVAINCAALTETLLESELFGHKAGSFTGAVRDRTGLFEEARKGTIFLDEIGETTPKTQLKFLRVLQEREILQVGATRPRKVDVRVIAATNRDLEKAVAEGTFREDLFYRLQVIRIEAPPLRERIEDILPLTRHFIKKCRERLELPKLEIDALCLDFLLEYSWPGNIRELENAIEYAAVLASENIIRPKDLPAKVTRRALPTEKARAHTLSLAEVECEHIRRVLELTKGNRKKAAEILQIGAATLYRRLSAMKTQKDELREP